MVRAGRGLLLEGAHTASFCGRSSAYASFSYPIAISDIIIYDRGKKRSQFLFVLRAFSSFVRAAKKTRSLRIIIGPR